MSAPEIKTKQDWTISDRLKEAWDKSKGPLEIALAGALGVALYKFHPEMDKYTKLAINALGAAGLAKMVVYGIEDIKYYHMIYKGIHTTLNNKISEK